VLPLPRHEAQQLTRHYRCVSLSNTVCNTHRGLKNPGYRAVLDWVLQLRQEIGIPHTLRDLGIGTDKLDVLSQEAFNDPSTGGNPVPAGVAEMKQMFIASIEARL
jgi:hypothetical protein